jgi:hypothetical protein
LCSSLYGSFPHLFGHFRNPILSTSLDGPRHSGMGQPSTGCFRPRAAAHAWPFPAQNDNNRRGDGLLKIADMAESVSSSAFHYRNQSKTHGRAHHYRQQL